MKVQLVDISYYQSDIACYSMDSILKSQIHDGAHRFFNRKIENSDDFEWACWCNVRDGNGIYGKAMNVLEYHDFMNAEDICDSSITYRENLVHELIKGSYSGV